MRMRRKSSMLQNLRWTETVSDQPIRNMSNDLVVIDMQA
jgi:hypothetical protein